MTVRRLARQLGAVAMVLGAWVIIVLALPFVGPAGRLVAVVGDPQSATVAVAAAGGRVVDIKGRVVLARSDRSDFAARLYGTGASLVLEGRVAAGCLSLV